MTAPAGRGGRLSPLELATASVLGSLTVVLVLAGWFVPHATAISGLGVVPMAVVAHRHRPRAVVAAAAASCVVAFLVAGTGPIAGIVLCAIIGGIAGHARQRDWGPGRVLVAVAVAGPGLAAIYIGLLVLFSSIRKLALRQIRDAVRGVAKTLAQFPGMAPVGSDLNRAAGFLVRNWWQCLGSGVVVLVAGLTFVMWRLIAPLLERLDRLRITDRLADARDSDGAPQPVPVALDRAGYRYPGAGTDALTGVDLVVPARNLVAVVGPNGSGKSTLARLIAGAPPTSGLVRRGGPVGLGRPGGTAIVAQRPESQVLGVRAADDVVWGLPSSERVDIEGLLSAVGLPGMAARETSTLSGGELQRLAVAAALARRPALLVADEATSMVDAAGRVALVELLSDLPRTHGVAVVEVTHRPVEAARADTVLRLSEGRATIGPPPSSPPAPAPTWRRRSLGGPLLRLEGVGHVYADRTPWAQTALADIDLAVHRGEGVLVVGDNGSGKSTLAWILAGLLRPTAGDCLLEDRPAHRQIGRVAIAFQHARLQVQRSTVGADVRDAGGVDRGPALDALRLVGLDGAALWDRPVDALSGGQLRRLALAGLLAGRPDVLVLDEPLAGLDEAGRSGLISVLHDLRRDQGVTLVVISHDLEGAGEVCDRTVALRHGRIVADDPSVPVPAPGAGA